MNMAEMSRVEPRCAVRASAHGADDRLEIRHAAQTYSRAAMPDARRDCQQKPLLSTFSLMPRAGAPYARLRGAKVFAQNILMSRLIYIISARARAGANRQMSSNT